MCKPRQNFCGADNGTWALCLVRLVPYCLRHAFKLKDAVYFKYVAGEMAQSLKLTALEESDVAMAMERGRRAGTRTA